MALHQSYTCTNIATFLSDLAAFADANGWTVVTSTSTLVEVSKGGTLFLVEYSTSSKVTLKATPSGGTISTGNVFIDSLSAGAVYRFVSCGDSLYIGRPNGGYLIWGGLLNIVDKIGNWSGGAMVIGLEGYSQDLFGPTAGKQTTLWINGVWTPVSNVNLVGMVVGNLESTGDQLPTRQPMSYNAAILPVPVTIFLRASTTSLWKPAGFAPGLYRCKAGNVHATGDILTIGGVDYLLFPQYGMEVSVGNAKDLLFKLSA